MFPQYARDEMLAGWRRESRPIYAAVRIEHEPQSDQT